MNKATKQLGNSGKIFRGTRRALIFVVVADNERGESPESNELSATPRVIDKRMMATNVDYNATGEIIKMERPQQLFNLDSTSPPPKSFNPQKIN